MERELSMPMRRAVVLAVLARLLAVGAGSAQASAQLVSVATWGNLHAGGVVATIAGDADGDASAALAWRRAGQAAFRAAQPLVRVDSTRFVGSLFGLTPGGSWEARVTLSDPDGVTGEPEQTASLATRAARLPEPTLRTLYVAPWGDDGNAGTDPDFPLATVQAASNRAQAGDRVSIAPGVYREEVAVAASGTAAQPIVFRGAGPAAVLDGADAAIAAGVPWTDAGDGVWSRVTGFPTGHVVTEQGRLFRYDSLADLEALAAGPPGGFWFDGATLRVKFSDGSAPAAHSMQVARLENGFVLDGVAHVRVENLEIRHFGSGDYGKGVYLRWSDDCAVRSCRIHEVGAAGVWIKGGARNLVEDNEIWDTSIPGWDWNWTKGSSAENDGVAMTDDLGRGNVVRRNVLHGTFNGIGGCGSAAPPDGFTSETDLYENVLYQHNDDAFEPEGWCANVRLWGNRIEDVHMAFAVAPAAPGPTWIVRNVAWDFGNTRTSQQDGYLASALKINSGYPTPVGPLLLYHNTFWSTAAGTTALALLDPGESTWVRARNNLFAGTGEAIYKVNPVLLDFDRDDLWRSTAGRLAWWEGTSFADLAALRAGTGQEAAGIQAAPALVAPAAGDFTPTAGSPLVDAGIALPGLNDSAIGDPPDLGAVERSFLFADGFEEGSTVRWSQAEV
jgi:hypothetical protein